MNKKTAIFSLIFILLISLFLRIYNLNKHDFWYDEATSLITAKNIAPQTLMDYGKIFTEPPLFCFLLKLWIILSKNESLFRLFPLIFGLLSVVPIYFVGKALFNKKVGLISAFLLTISPFHIYYSQELKGYTLITFLSLLSVYFLIRILKENKLWSWMWFIVFTVLCLYTHNMSLLLLLAENVYFLSFYKRHKKISLKWLISQSTILILYVPWLVTIIYQIVKIKIPFTFFWVPKPSLQIIIHTFNIFNLGYNATGRLYTYGSLVFFPLFLWGFYKGIKEKINIYLLLCWLFIPLIAAILISMMLKHGSIYLYRTFIYISPAYYIVIANGLNNIKNYKFSSLTFSLIIILSIVALKNYYQNVLPLPVIPYHPSIFIKKDYSSASDYIKKEFQKGDIVAHTSRSTVAPFMYYHNNELKEKWAVSPDNLDYLHNKEIFSHQPSLSKLSLLEPFLGASIQKLSQDYQRIWLVFSGWELNDREEPEIKDWLDKNFQILKEKEFKGINIYLYKTSDKKDTSN